jgi:hypothetical protein
MQALDLNVLDDLLEGYVDLRHRPGAVQPVRFPVAELSFLDPATRWVATCAAGVRLRMVTDSTSLRLTATQRAAIGLETERSANYELYIDGRLFAREAAEGGARLTMDGGLEGDEHASITFTDLPAGEKSLELWLPQTATVSITGVELDDGARWTGWPDRRRRLIFHGSSISHCMEADGSSGAWPAVAAALGDMAHLNLGWAGSCLLSGQAARTIARQRADGIVLKLGINVWFEGMLKERTFLDNAHAMISVIRDQHPRTPILVVSPIYSPGREDESSEGGVSLTRMRYLLEGMVETRVRAGDEAINYLSGLALFSDAGYRRMGERFFAQALANESWLASVDA